MPSMTNEKVRENRLRRMAGRQGLQLRKSPQKDPRSIGYGRWQIYDERVGTVVAGPPHGDSLDLDQVEKFLMRER